MTRHPSDTLPGVQLTHRCAAYDGEKLCGSPAPYLVNGTSLCPDHAATYAQYVLEAVT